MYNLTKGLHVYFVLPHPIYKNGTVTGACKDGIRFWAEFETKDEPVTLLLVNQEDGLWLDHTWRLTPEYNILDYLGETYDHLISITANKITNSRVVHSHQKNNKHYFFCGKYVFVIDYQNHHILHTTSGLYFPLFNLYYSLLDSNYYGIYRMLLHLVKHNV